MSLLPAVAAALLKQLGMLHIHILQSSFQNLLSLLQEAAGAWQGNPGEPLPARGSQAGTTPSCRQLRCVQAERSSHNRCKSPAAAWPCCAARRGLFPHWWHFRRAQQWNHSRQHHPTHLCPARELSKQLALQGWIHYTNELHTQVYREHMH